MEIKSLSAGLSVCPQIEPADLGDIKDRGFGAVICTRPDHEGDGQPLFQDVAAAAKELGLATAYVPIIPGQVTGDDVTAFGAALDALPGPVLAYCRSGARAENVWSLWQARVA